MKLFNVVALKGLGNLANPGRASLDGLGLDGLDGEVDTWSPGSRDDLLKTGVVENAKILV